MLSFLVRKNRLKLHPGMAWKTIANHSCLTFRPAFCAFGLREADSALSGQLAAHTFANSCYFKHVTTAAFKIISPAKLT